MKHTLMVLFAAAACLAQPRIRDAQLETKALGGAALEATVASIVASHASPVWIGWSVPMVATAGRSVCWSDHGDSTARAIALEPPQVLHVLLRAEDRKLMKVRSATPDCEIDGNGASVVWLTGVQPAQSVAFLVNVSKQSTPEPKQERRITDGVIAAIALHQDPAADAALDAFAASSQSESTRRSAVFWLGNARGRHGYETLLKILRDDASDKVREHAIFALTQNKEPGAVEAILKTAREDRSAHVRGQALFWLAQAAQRKLAAEEIARAIDNDPETEVKRQALFALTRLPNGEGVPKLIEVARTNHNVEVRKQAMFWLGQSKDPRATQFFEQVLTK